jgi:hypothetical protein
MLGHVHCTWFDMVCIGMGVNCRLEVNLIQPSEATKPRSTNCSRLLEYYLLGCFGTNCVFF